MDLRSTRPRPIQARSLLSTLVVLVVLLAASSARALQLYDGFETSRISPMRWTALETGAVEATR
jgi:hypothetical protein